MNQLLTYILLLVAFVAWHSRATGQCTANAGTLSSDPIVQNADSSFTLTAYRQNNVTLFPGAEMHFLLTSGDDFLVLDGSAVSSFRVSSPGYYNVHTLLGELSDAQNPDYIAPEEYAADGRTLADIEALISNRCADLDLVGTYFFVPSDFGLVCNLSPATLAPDFGELSPGRDQVTLSAAIKEDAQANPTHEVRYLLALGRDPILVDIALQPSFAVAASDTGLYSIYSFIAELDDPFSQHYFDPNSIAFGQDRLDDFVSNYVDLDICAKVGFEAGQVYVPSQPSATACVIEAGLLEPDGDLPVMPIDSVALRANRLEATFRLADQEVVYFLTRSNQEIIIGYNDEPFFKVANPGEFSIHTAVMEVSDAASTEYFDLSSIVLGQTTLLDLERMLIWEGVCAAVDTIGAGFEVDPSMVSSTTASADLDIDFTATVVNGQVRVLLNTAVDVSGILRISDPLGRPVQERSASVLRGAPQVVNLGLPQRGGIYFISFSAGALSKSVAVLTP